MPSSGELSRQITPEPPGRAEPTAVRHWAKSRAAIWAALQTLVSVQAEVVAGLSRLLY